MSADDEREAREIAILVYGDVLDRLAAAEAQRDTLAGALRLIVKQPDTYTAIRRIASAALAAVAPAEAKP